MENSLKIFLLSVTCVITMSVVSVVLYAFNVGKTTVSDANLNLLHIAFQNSENGLEKLDGTVITGAKVKQIITANEDLFFRVKTSRYPLSFVDFEDMNDSENAYYIAPTVNFVCKLLYDTLDNAVGLSFSEEGVLLSSSEAEEELTLMQQSLSVQLVAHAAEESAVNAEVGNVDASIIQLRKEIEERKISYSTTATNLNKILQNLKQNSFILTKKIPLLQEEISKQQQVLKELEAQVK